MSLAAWEKWVSQVKERSHEACARFIERDAQQWASVGRSQFRCISPLRSERTPSFYVYADQGRWHDFGTGEGGDLIQYVQLRDRCSFKDALITIAPFVGVEDWKSSGGDPSKAIDIDKILEAWRNEEDERSVFELLTRIVEEICHPALPRLARAHLRDHYGLTDDFIDMEKIGWVPADLWTVCRAWWPEVREELLLKTGFFVVPGAMEPKPAQTERILFPYWKDGFARYTIGRHFFGGARADQVQLEDWDKGKYKKHLTYSQDKHPHVAKLITNELLWNEDCYRAIKPDAYFYLAEGITDAMSLKMLGLPVMSAVTTRVSGKQIDRTIVFAKRAKGVIICNDNDINARGEEPGKRGAIFMARELSQAGIPVRIATLPRPQGQNKIDVNELITQWINETTRSMARTA